MQRQYFFKSIGGSILSVGTAGGLLQSCAMDRETKGNYNKTIGNNHEIAGNSPDEDLITGGVYKSDGKQRFLWYEKRWVENELKWIEHQFGVMCAPGYTPYHGFYCGEMAWSDLDNDGDIDFVYSGVGGGFLGWFENISAE